MLAPVALAKIHPCLIADPQSYVSMFAAAGLTVGTDIKTIIAKTLFERLTHVSKRFDTKTQDFCIDMSLKRNAELHSGEAPFEATLPGAWEGRFWHTAEIILEASGSTIDSWLGANQAKAPKQLLAEYIHAISDSAKIKVETARERFNARKKKEREIALTKAASLELWEIGAAFDMSADSVWPTECPACQSKAFLAGAISHEEPSDEHDGEVWETVDVYYIAEEFHCPTCQLQLDSQDTMKLSALKWSRSSKTFGSENMNLITAMIKGWHSNVWWKSAHESAQLLVN